jgi:hypothetical protein
MSEENTENNNKEWLGTLENTENKPDWLIEENIVEQAKKYYNLQKEAKDFSVLKEYFGVPVDGYKGHEHEEVKDYFKDNINTLEFIKDPLSDFSKKHHLSEKTYIGLLKTFGNLYNSILEKEEERLTQELADDKELLVKIDKDIQCLKNVDPNLDYDKISSWLISKEDAEVFHNLVNTLISQKENVPPSNISNNEPLPSKDEYYKMLIDDRYGVDEDFTQKVRNITKRLYNIK